jgi:uncharacterized protein (TIGR02452 family)
MSARLAEETVLIAHNGRYVCENGRPVSIGLEVTRAVTGTRLYLARQPLPRQAAPDIRPVIEVTTESTLEAGRRLGRGTAALVFASALNPGGEFLDGEQTQEGDIARSSALFLCLRTVREYYLYHRAQANPLYTGRVIYSPDVPVFRGPDARLLARPYALSFLTAAAPNLAEIRRRKPELAGVVPGVLVWRAERVLRVAAANGHRTIVLGAWGCGFSGNSPQVVAAAFRIALRRLRRFDQVVFAIRDSSEDGRTYRAFLEAFATGRPQ